MEAVCRNNLKSFTILTHMNQVVVGGVLWGVQGLGLLGAAGGPRQPLVS